MERQRYPSDLTDAEWLTLEPHVPLLRKSNAGRPREVELREIIHGILYVARSGCPWRMLPHDLPDWRNVYDHFRRWRQSGGLAMIHDLLRGQVRVAAGRQAQPSAGTTPARRSPGSSAISWWTRWGCC